MSSRKATVLVNLIGEDLPSSQPLPIPVSPLSRSDLARNSTAPTQTRYHTYGSVDGDSSEHQYSKSLVQPVFGEEDIMLSSSVDSQSSLNIRRKEAAKQWSSKSVEDSKKNQSSDSQGDWVHLDNTNKRSDHLTSDLQTLVHLIKGNVGTGLLALPLAISNAGLALGGVALFILGIIATHCMIMLVDTAHTLTKRYPKYQTLNYAQTAEVAVGEHTQQRWIIKTAEVVVNIFLIVTQFGFCAVYFVFIAENLDQVFCSAFGVNFNVHAWIAIIILPIIVFCWIRNLEDLIPFTTVANICIVISLLIILYEEINAFVTTDPRSQAAIIRSKNVTDYSNNPGGIELIVITSLPLFFGNAIYAFEGIGMVLPLENKMNTPNHFKPVIYIGMSIVVFLYLFVGIIGYAVYGQSIQGSITLNLEGSYDRIAPSILFLIAKLLYAYAIFASFMLQFYVPMDFLEPVFVRLTTKLCRMVKFEYMHPDHYDKLYAPIWMAFRAFLVTCAAAVALAVPDLGDLISLIGAVASSGLALIFPPLLQIIVFVKHRDSSSYAVAKHIAWITKDSLIILLGVIGFVLGTYASINGIVHYKGDENTECVNFYPR